MPTTDSLVSAEMQAAETFLDVFYLRAKEHPNQIYLRQPYGDKWTELTWAYVDEQARRLVSALRDLGLEKGDHVGLLSKNCCHWFIADLAILMGGYVSVPFFPSLTSDQLAQVIELSHIKAIFVGKLDDWEAQKAGVPQSVHAIAFPHYGGSSEVTDCHEWNTLTEVHEPVSDPHRPTREEMFTIIYTSGTTGNPKGVMLTYEAIHQAFAHERREPVYGIYLGKAERLFSYLPLNHIAERVANEITSIMVGSTVAFTESLDTFAANLRSVQPTLFFAVPRIWTKFQQGILAQMPQNRLDLLLKIPIVNAYIRNKISDSLGLSKAHVVVSGAAALPPPTLKWFRTLGIHIQEVYGASETCSGVTFSPADAIIPGAVGKPLPGVEVNIEPETNEVLVKSPWLMLGYYNDPTKTAEVLQDGYYRTGDRGHLDENGYLVITGRSKDTFKSAKGEYILPAPIELQFAENPYVEQVLVTGLGLPQPIALVCLVENLLATGQADATRSLEETLTTINSRLPAPQKLACIVVMAEAWSEENGLMTPSMKIKRHKVDEMYESSYEQWYESSGTVIWLD